MELSRTIALMAVVLGLVLAAGYAAGEDNQAPALKQAAQKNAEEQQKRKEAYERLCSKPLKSDSDFAICRAAYKAFVATQK